MSSLHARTETHFLGGGGVRAWDTCVSQEAGFLVVCSRRRRGGGGGGACMNDLSFLPSHTIHRGSKQASKQAWTDR